MTEQELRDKIAEALAVQGVTDGYICDKTKDIADSILALFAPELAAAEKWRRVERAYNSSPPCDCPEWDGDKAECMIEAAKRMMEEGKG